MEGCLQIRLFGSPSVHTSNSDTIEFPTEKVKHLFAYLVLHRYDEHTRQALAGLFWGDYGDTHAFHSLSTGLWRLRKCLHPLQLPQQPYLFVDRRWVRFNTESLYSLDVAEFETRVCKGQQMSKTSPDHAAPLFGQALEFYRGALLEGCYADWCLAERERLHQLYLQALLHLMVYYGARQNYSEAIAMGQRILSDDPLREDIHRELMKLHVLDGQPAEAFKQYRICEEVLRKELDIEPMAETEELVAKLMGSSAPAITARPVPGTSGAGGTPWYDEIESMQARLDALVKKFEAIGTELGETVDVLNALMQRYHLRP
jgi:DNA-binding SARP family transcriptional activator